jgi:hypothetical protein
LRKQGRRGQIGAFLSVWHDEGVFNALVLGRRQTTRGLRSFAFATGLPFCVAALVQCSEVDPPSSVIKRKSSQQVEEPILEEPEEILPTSMDPDSGGLELGSRTRDGGSDASRDARPADASPRDAAADVRDARADARDTGPPPVLDCNRPLVEGDLRIVELMVSSRAGSGDDGEFVEIENRASCIVDLGQVLVESPRGTSVDRATFTAGSKLGPGKFAIVAGNRIAESLASGLPSGTLIAEFRASDVLKNDGDTVRILQGSTVVQSLAFPRIRNLTPGQSIVFPSDCAPADYSDWLSWSLAPTFYAGTFRGSPGAPNDDVTCF